MTSSPDIPEDELHAFIDGELTEDRYREVRSAIREDAALARRVAAFRSDKAMLRHAFSPAADQPRVGEGRHRGQLIAAILALALLSGLSVWRATQPAADDGIISTALRARESLREMGLKVPDLTRLGYRFDRLRLQDHGVELSYLDPSGGLFTLFLRRADGPPRFEQSNRGTMRICVWQDDRINVVMSGEISQSSMQLLAAQVYLDLSQ